MHEARAAAIWNIVVAAGQRVSRYSLATRRRGRFRDSSLGWKGSEGDKRRGQHAADVGVQQALG